MKEIEYIWRECERFQIQQKKQEFLTLLEYLDATMPIKNDCLEIGAYDGGTSVGFLNLFRNVVTVDLKARQSWEIIKKEYPHWLSVQANTHNPKTLKFIKSINKRYDFIFIDGDHSAEGVEMDFLVYKQFLKPGGVVAFHDIVKSSYHEENNCYVHKFWADYKDKYKNLEVVYLGDEFSGLFASRVPTKQWGGIGIFLNVNPEVR